MPIVSAEYLTEVATQILVGGVVAIPTDTVYGLASLATSAEAMAGLADLKGREQQQPIAVLVDSVEAVAPYLEDSHALDDVGRFWPGALTVVVRARRDM